MNRCFRVTAIAMLLTASLAANAAELTPVKRVEPKYPKTRVAEVFKQLPNANRPDVFDHVKRHQRFLGIHAR